MKQILLPILALLLTCCSKESDMMAETNSQKEIGKTLIVFYSYTGNCREIANSLNSMITADVVEIKTVAENQDYNANGYQLGNDLLETINANPESIESYPPIKDVSKDAEDYDNIIFVTPLWHSQMAAPAQTYLFKNRQKLEGKHFAMIVSSWSSGIATVTSNARRLLPDVIWAGEPLWINHNNHSKRNSLIDTWLKTQNFQSSDNMTEKMYITIDGRTMPVTLVDNNASRALVDKLQEGSLTVTLNSSADFEIWGGLGFSLPTENKHMNAQPGDVVLYNGSNICLFYGTNSWSYTPLGKIDNLTESELRIFLKAGESNIKVTLSLDNSTSVSNLRADIQSTNAYTLQGMPAQAGQHGIIIHNGKKIIR